MKPEEILKGNHIGRARIILTAAPQCGGHDEINPAVPHFFEVALGDLFVNGCEEEPEAASSLCHDLPPTLAERPLYGEHNTVHCVPSVVLNRRKDEVRLAVDDCLW